MNQQHERLTISFHICRWPVIGLACLAAVLVLACGTPVEHNSRPLTGAVNASSTIWTLITAAPRAATPTASVSLLAAPCQVNQLSIDRTGLGEGMGQVQAAWSLTNTSSTACSINGGLPIIELDNSDGHALTTSHLTALKTASTAPLVLPPSGKIWFFTDTLDDCPSGYQTFSGGPFREFVVLPGTQLKIRWAANGLGLDHTTLPGQCATMQVRESSLQTTEPTLQSEYGPIGTPAATP